MIYRITGSGLKEIEPVNFDLFSTGDVITTTSRYMGECVIYRHGDTLTAIDTDSLMTRSAGELSLLNPTHTGEMMPADEARRFFDLAHAMKEHQREEREKAAEHKANEIKRLAAELRAKYPWAVASSAKLSEYARAAKNIKKELSLAFPGVKFSVKSESYSGGDSVDVRWENGPRYKDVEAVINKYQYGNFNGMDDIYEYDHSAMAEAVGIVLGQAKYVHGSRSTSEDVREAVTAAVRASHKIDGEGELARVGSIWLSDYVYRVLAQSTIPPVWSSVAIDYSKFEGEAIFS